MMILKKALPVCSALLLAWPFRAASQVIKEDQGGKDRKVLSAVVSALQNNHYSPIPFNDELSEQLWTKFLETIDPLKQFFSRTDLLALGRYRTSLDEEIRGETEPRFLYAVYDLYRIRIQEARAEYKDLLKRPFFFNREEYVHPGGSSSSGFAKDRRRLTEIRRKYVKYQVLQTLVQLQEQDTLPAAEVRLEQEARRKVAKRLDRAIVNKIANGHFEKLFALYINCFTHLMDPHTNYLSAVDAKKFRNRMSNNVAGIGADLAGTDEGARIVRLESTGAAASNGLGLNDEIVRLGEGSNGGMMDLAGLSPAEIADMVRGEKGSTLRLDVKKPGGKMITVSLQRSGLDRQEASVKALVIRRNEKKIGYITFPLFYQDVDPFGPQVATDVALAIEQLRQRQVDVILFDLRRNGGGSLQEVTRMVSLLIKGGPVVQVRERDGVPVSRSSLDAVTPFGSNSAVQQIYDGPLAVLVDGFSASASEIFAAAIQDYKRGVVIGSSSTHGKGTVQRNVLLGNGELGTLHLTFSQFYRVNGASTQQKGVVPDIILPDLNDCVRSRERDMPASLSWDMVAPVAYETWGSGPDLERLRKFAANRMENDSVFSVIKRNAAKYCEQIAKDIPLKMDAYRRMLNGQAAVNAENSRVLKLPAGKELDVELLFPAGNNGWIDRICHDIYIEQAVAIAAEMCD